MSTPERSGPPAVPIVNAAAFAQMDPFTKGLCVGCLGQDDSQPHVPATFDPEPDDRAEYERGLEMAANRPGQG